MDIHHERREYLLANLTRESLDDSPIVQFEKWLGEAKTADINDPTAMMVATVDRQGQPSQRTVLLKQFNQQGFVFYTNLDSKKARQIATNDRVSLIFPWLSLERQVIIAGRAERVTAKESLDYFLSRPRDSQLAAWVSRQSSPISSRAMMMEKFAEIKSRFAQGEIPLPKFWGGYRVVPERIEFWSGGAKRIHDRFEYIKNDSGEWQIERLQP
jgi:pyridoxamine 5'-phosphate oxidase